MKEDVIITPLVFRCEDWDTYAFRVRRSIGLDVRMITSSLTKADRKQLKRRATKPLPAVSFHNCVTEIGTYTTVPCLEEA